MSFPTRERGLKYALFPTNQIYITVVPHAGTWIEIALIFAQTASSSVVPHAGTWIEILNIFIALIAFLCRSPRGNVD